MKAITKKILLPLIFALLLCLFSAAAFADGTAAVAEVVSLNDVTLTLYDDGELVVSGTGPIENNYQPLRYIFTANIPIEKVVIEQGVTAIGNNSFAWMDALCSVEIADSVTSIGSRAFSQCAELTDLALPNGLTFIGDYAFMGCSSLTQITIPDGVSSVSEGTFSNCTNLSSVELPDGVSSIGNFAFRFCMSLKTIDFPSELTLLGDRAFADSGLISVTIPDTLTDINNSFCYCDDLQEIRLSPNHPVFFLDDQGVLYTRDQTSLVFAPRSLAGNYEILSGVTKIAYGTFQNCTALTGIVIPDSVVSIGPDAFLNCSGLTDVEIPEGVQSIDYRAFYWCSSLSHVSFPSSVTTMSSMFIGCDLLTTAGPTGGSYNIEYGWTDAIPDSAFNECTALTEIAFPASITSIGYFSFASSGLTRLNLPDTVTSINNYAFAWCNSLQTVKLSGGLSSISDSAFVSCPNLYSVYIPAGVTAIQNAAFAGCNTLRAVCYEGSQSDWSNIRIGDFNDPLQDAQIYYGCATPDPTRTLRLPADLSLIEAEAFANTDAQTIVIPATVGTVDARAFAGCPQLQCLCFEGSPNRIDDSIVTDCGPITVFAAEGSSAKAWASAHGFAFMVK